VSEPVVVVAEDHHAPPRREEMPGSRLPGLPAHFVGLVIATL
jgi:hypothetical protein